MTTDGVTARVTTRPIPGASGKYEAGDDGGIYCYSRARCNAKKPYPFRLAVSLPRDGYPHVAILLGGKRVTKAVHTLVCTAFHGQKPSPIHEVRHLDGDRMNSRPSNLCWGTPSENEADKRRHGRVAEGERHGNARLNDEAVRILRIAIPDGRWNAVDAAAVFGVDPSTIRRIVAGRDWRSVEVAA
jgi:hypothetical protein